MCRRIVIDCTWDDETAEEDVVDMFDAHAGYNQLTPEFERQLQRLIDNNFMGGVTIQVMELP